MARMWWKAHPDDKGDIEGCLKFTTAICGFRKFRSRRAAIQWWALWNYKGLRSGWVVRPVSFEHLGEPRYSLPPLH